MNIGLAFGWPACNTPKVRLLVTQVLPAVLQTPNTQYDYPSNRTWLAVLRYRPQE
jgi:hypothetical protein